MLWEAKICYQMFNVLVILKVRKMASCYMQQTANRSTVDRLTDTSQYTGSHKLRFDEEGKGKGLAGRDYVPKGAGHVPGSLASQQDGYVAAYKGEGTYNTGLKQSTKPKAVRMGFIWVMLINHT